MPRWVVLRIVAITLVGTAFLFVFSVWPRKSSGGESQAEYEKRLLYQTDHMALSAACEQLWQQSDRVRKFGHYNPDTKSFSIQSTHPALPAAIRALHQSPAQVEVDARTIRIEMGGGFCHYGFLWDSESPPRFGLKHQHGGPMTTKQVATNLWFYTEKPKLPEAK